MNGLASPDILLRFAAKLEGWLSEVPHPYPDRAAHDAAIERLIRRVTDDLGPKGVTIRSDWRGGELRALGLRSTSTIGLAGACRNWIQQARKKTEAARV